MDAADYIQIPRKEYIKQALNELDVEGSVLDKVGSTAPTSVGGNVPYDWLRMTGWTTVTSNPPGTASGAL